MLEQVSSLTLNKQIKVGNSSFHNHALNPLHILSSLLLPECCDPLGMYRCLPYFGLLMRQQWPFVVKLLTMYVHKFCPLLFFLSKCC